MIAIIDYGMGNVGSIMNMLRKTGADACITSDAERIKRAEKIVLPGVGAFDNAMENLKKLELIHVLEEAALKHVKPLLGICLGMQLLTKESEEGEAPGLGFIDAKTKRFRFEKENGVKVPHMGWNTVRAKLDHELFRNEGQLGELRFYFVHSYHVVCTNYADVLAETLYGYNFASAIGNANIMGVQFHPEKSHKFGMAIFRNFAFGF